MRPHQYADGSATETWPEEGWFAVEIFKRVCVDDRRRWWTELETEFPLTRVAGAPIAWTLKGVCDNGGVGACLAESSRVCLISWRAAARTFVVLANTGWEFQRCTGTGLENELERGGKRCLVWYVGLL